jgi:hypothetical protein
MVMATYERLEDLVAELRLLAREVDNGFAHRQEPRIYAALMQAAERIEQLAELERPEAPPAWSFVHGLTYRTHTFPAGARVDRVMPADLVAQLVDRGEASYEQPEKIRAAQEGTL